MARDIGLEWREANSGNGATVSISGDIVTIPQGIPDLRMLNTGFNDCGKLVIQVARKSILMKIDLVRK
jgi:hypothetical protein